MSTFLRSAARLGRPAHLGTLRPITSTARPAAAAAAAAVQQNGGGTSIGPFFHEEPAGPTVQTAIPGPKSKAALQELDEVFDTRSVNMMADYNKSFGNYIA